MGLFSLDIRRYQLKSALNSGSLELSNWQKFCKCFSNAAVKSLIDLQAKLSDCKNLNERIKLCVESHPEIKACLTLEFSNDTHTSVGIFIEKNNQKYLLLENFASNSDGTLYFDSLSQQISQSTNSLLKYNDWKVTFNPLILPKNTSLLPSKELEKLESYQINLEHKILNSNTTINTDSQKSFRIENVYAFNKRLAKKDLSIPHITFTNYIELQKFLKYYKESSLSIPITINMFYLNADNQLSHSEAFLLEKNKVYFFSNNSDSQNLISTAEHCGLNIYRPASDAFLFYNKAIKNQKDYSSCSIIADFTILKLQKLFKKTHSVSFDPKVISHIELPTYVDKISQIAPQQQSDNKLLQELGIELPSKISLKINEQHNYFVMPQQITNHSQTSLFYKTNRCFHEQYSSHDYYKMYEEHYISKGKDKRIENLPDKYIKKSYKWN